MISHTPTHHHPTKSPSHTKNIHEILTANLKNLLLAVKVLEKLLILQ
jgi:hypothetical protein